MISHSQRFALIAAVASIGLFANVSRADTSTGSTPPAAAHSAKHHAGAHGTAGKVVSFDAQSGALVLKPRSGANVTVFIDANTKVTIDGKAATSAGLKANERVMVATSGSADHLTAVTVAVHMNRRKGAGA